MFLHKMFQYKLFYIVSPGTINYNKNANSRLRHCVCDLLFTFLLTAPIAIVFATGNYIYLGINCNVSQSKGIKPGVGNGIEKSIHTRIKFAK